MLEIVTTPQPQPEEQPAPESDEVIAGNVDEAARVDPPAPTAAAWVDGWKAPGGGE